MFYLKVTILGLCIYRVLLENVNLSKISERVVRSLAQSSTLDYSQAAAVIAGLTRELALIQGPPGTGNTRNCLPGEYNYVYFVSKKSENQALLCSQPISSAPNILLWLSTQSMLMYQEKHFWEFSLSSCWSRTSVKINVTDLPWGQSCVYVTQIMHWTNSWKAYWTLG